MLPVAATAFALGICPWMVMGMNHVLGRMLDGRPPFRPGRPLTTWPRWLWGNVSRDQLP